jgi:DNA primase
MHIEPRIIDEILNKTDIVELIGKSIKLKKSGTNYFACCPFHNEKTPSFSINSKQQFFHCFGCGESGNAIGFIIKYYGYDFVEAVKYLARQCGVTIEESQQKFSPEQIKQQKQQKLTLQDTINKASKFYQTNLINTPLALSYIKNRGLSNEIIQKFIIGYAPDGYTALATIFNDYQHNQYLSLSGLTSRNSQDNVYDKFRQRIMFPIRNVRGEIIAFGGRVIDKSEPKYLNSPETELFNKSNELYGLFEAQKSLRETQFAVVVEGYMDVIALHQFGVTNAVATMGTAATEEHIKKLFRQCDDIYFCFDGDTAGKKAAWRALERSIELVSELKQAHFMFLPAEHDPDSFIRQHGKDKFIDNLQQASLSLSEFLLAELSSKVNIKTEEGKVKLIGLTKPYLEQTKIPALQVMLKKQLAKQVELQPVVLESILNNRSRYAFYNSAKSDYNNQPKSVLPTPKLNNIKLAIQAAVKNIEWVHNYKLPDDIDNLQPEVRELVIFLDYLNHHYSSAQELDINQLIENTPVTQFALKSILFATSRLELTQQEFINLLDGIFGISKTKTNKIPKILLKK